MNTLQTSSITEHRKENNRLSSANAGTTLYRVGWVRGNESGEERDVYKSFVSAVRMAEMLQQSVNDSPVSAQFVVNAHTGTTIKTVYRCE